MIDCCVAFAGFVVTQFLVFRPLYSAVGITDDWFKSGFNIEMYTMATISIPVWLYFSLLESSPWRATLGKRMLGLYVVPSRGQSQIGVPRALLRTVVKLLPWELAHLGNNLPVPVWYTDEPEFRVGFVFSGILMTVYVAVMCLNKNRRGVHDMIAGTIVKKSDSTDG